MSIGAALGVWLAMAVLAVANGGFRENFVIPRTSESIGHIISTVLLASLLWLLVWISMPWLQLKSITNAWLVGVMWMCLTLTFEFIAGHFVFGNPWSKITADYNLLRGRIWVFIPLTLLFAPTTAFQLTK